MVFLSGWACRAVFAFRAIAGLNERNCRMSKDSPSGNDSTPFGADNVVRLDIRGTMPRKRKALPMTPRT